MREDRVEQDRVEQGLEDANRTADHGERQPVTTAVEVARVEQVAPEPLRGLASEEVARIQVEPEDRLAFRVGVNLLTLALVGLAVYLLWRRFFAGG